MHRSINCHNPPSAYFRFFPLVERDFSKEHETGARYTRPWRPIENKISRTLDFFPRPCTPLPPHNQPGSSTFEHRGRVYRFELAGKIKKKNYIFKASSGEVPGVSAPRLRHRLLPDNESPLLLSHSNERRVNDCRLPRGEPARPVFNSSLRIRGASGSSGVPRAR